MVTSDQNARRIQQLPLYGLFRAHKEWGYQFMEWRVSTQLGMLAVEKEPVPTKLMIHGMY